MHARHRHPSGGNIGIPLGIGVYGEAVSRPALRAIPSVNERLAGISDRRLDLVVVALQQLVEAPERWINALLLVALVCQIVQATLTGIVFSGSLALERTLLYGDSTSIELAQVQDRIVEVVRVGTLTPVEVARFVREILPVLTDGEAVAELREVSRSVPRRVVRLLAHLRKLSVASKAPITAAMVREAGERLVAA